MDPRSLNDKNYDPDEMKVFLGNLFSNLHCINIYQRAIYALPRGERSSILEFCIIVHYTSATAISMCPRAINLVGRGMREAI